MSWFSGSFADTLFGTARRIFDALLAPVSRARADWERQYVAADAAVAAQLRQIEARARSSYRALTLAEVTMMHSQSKQAADLAYGALKLARSALDAMGKSIVETARQRQALERHARTVRGAARASLQREINSLHQLRDVHLVPDKDRVKRQRDLLQAEVTRLNMRTGELRDYRDRLIRTTEMTAGYSRREVSGSGGRHQIASGTVKAIVKWFDVARGFGFLTLPDGREPYVNASNLTRSVALVPGMGVSCEIRQHPDGRIFAVKVSTLGRS
jgi:cold shock CspA family protein